MKLAKYVVPLLLLVLVAFHFIFRPRNADSPSVVEDPTSGEAPAPGAAKTANTGAPINAIQSFEDFKREFGQNWDARKDEKGRLYRITGGRISGVRPNVQTITQFAQRIAPVFGGSSDQVQFARGQSKKLPGLTSFIFDQQFEGHRVYSGKLRIAHDGDDAILQIDSTLVPVTGKLPKDKANFEQAIQSVRSAHPEWNLGAVTSDTVVYVSENGEPDLVWIANTDRQRPNTQSYEVLVSASTGRVVKERTMVTID